MSTRKARRKDALLRAKKALKGKPLGRKQRRRAMHRQWAMFMAGAKD